MTTTEPTSVHVFMNYYHAICEFQNTAAEKLNKWVKDPSSVSFQWEKSLLKELNISHFAIAIISGLSAIMGVTFLFTAIVMVIKEYRKVITIPLAFLGMSSIMFFYKSYRAALAEAKVAAILKNYLELTQQKSTTEKTINDIKASIETLDLTDRGFN